MAPQPIYHLFVYGSLRSGFHSHMYEYISRYFSPVGEAKVKGMLYDLGSYPAGVPARDETFITGELYVIRHPEEFGWAIGQLDDYEGVNVAFDEIQLYRRELTEAVYQGKKYPAWIYWYNGSVSGRPVIASGDLMEYMHQKKQ